MNQKKKKIVFFSVGIPDPTQGGSGIFNYSVCQELLRRNFEVKAFFRVSQWFLKDHCDRKYLPKLSKAGLQYTLVEERNGEKPTPNTNKLLDQVHHFFLCREVVEGAATEISQADGCISLDLGWAYGLSTRRPERAVCFLQGSLRDRLQHVAYGQKLSPFSLSYWKALCQFWRVRHSYYGLIKKTLWPGAILGAFALNFVKEIQAHGIPSRYFQWFTNEVNPVGRPEKYRGRLVALHVGTLDSSVSRQMMDYWIRELFPELARLPFELEIRFVGRTEKTFSTNVKNIRLQFLGHKDSLEEEFASADVYLSPAKYPTMVGTRILTALSYGVPVITDQFVGLRFRELVPDKDIVYASCPTEIRSVLESIPSDYDRFQEIGRSGRKIWERYYRPSPNVSEILRAMGLDDA